MCDGDGMDGGNGWLAGWQWPVGLVGSDEVSKRCRF